MLLLFFREKKALKMAKWMTGPINFGQKKDRRPNPSREDLDLPSFQMREMIDKEGTERMYPNPGGPDLRLSISARNLVMYNLILSGSKHGMILQPRRAGQKASSAR